MAELSVLMRSEARVLTCPPPLLRHESIGERLWPITHTVVMFVVSDIIIIYVFQAAQFKPSVLSAFDEGPGSKFTVLLQYVLLCFIYFSKVGIAKFLRSFRCLSISI